MITENLYQTTVQMLQLQLLQRYYAARAQEGETTPQKESDVHNGSATVLLSPPHSNEQVSFAL